jgi:hypothetical protein
VRDGEEPRDGRKDVRGAEPPPDRTSLWPKDWPDPGSLGMGILGIGLGIPLVVGGLVEVGGALAGRRPPDVLAKGLALAGFGATLVLGSGLMRPSPWASGEPELATVQDGGTLRTGVSLAYSRPRVVSGMIAFGCLAVAGMGLLLAAGMIVFGGWGVVGGLPLLVLGLPVLVAGTVGVIVPLRHGAGRGWRLVLLPAGLLRVKGRSRMLLPWEAINHVSASRGRWPGAPKLELVVDKAAVRKTARRERRERPRVRGGGVDLTFAVWTLAVDPSLLYAALVYYTAHPEARPELADDRGVQRLLHRDLR